MNAKDVSGKIRRAVERRRGLVLEDTDAFRVLDGEGDGLPGIVIDAFSGRWLVQTKGERPERELVDACLGFCDSVWWKRLDRDVKLAPSAIGGEAVATKFCVAESGIRYMCDFSAGYSQGIFLDQRLNRAAVRQRGASSLLNLFSYTCGFSVAAALGGAVTTSLDLSQPYLDWGRENMKLNDIDVDEHYFCKGDALRWLERWSRNGRRFEGVVADPPTFSRNEKGKVWRVESDYGALAEAVAKVVEPGGWALFCTNYRGIEGAGFKRLVEEACGGMRSRNLEMPPEYRGERYLKSVWIDFA